MSLERIGAALRSMISRGKVTDARMGGRTLLQVTGLDNETISGVELLLPPGYTARPAPGADIVLHQVLGSRDHLVAHGGDTVGQAQPDLAPGEFGLRDANGQIVIFRGGSGGAGYIEIMTPTYLKITATQYVEFDTPLLRCSGDIVDNFYTQSETMALQRGRYDGHTHTVPDVAGGSATATTNPPTQQET